MAWDHLSITNPHLVYIILGGFTSLFMLCSSIIKERMYIGEATVATLCGVIFGPHAANLINPDSWGNVDLLTLEFSRIVLVVQCFAVGVELPKFYMERHWKSVALLLIPVMTFGWLVVSLFIWWMVPPLNWLESLIVAACVTATDPVLASSVVGKGKFAKRVPKHLRDLLSAESGCNDGMAFPFVYLGLYLVQDHLDARQTVFHWFVYTILYECICGAIFGFTVGYTARHAIKYAEEHDLIDRESFLVFYFVLALFCAGAGSMLGMDDLLIGFAAGVGFSNDGWFHGKTEESHVSNVIDLLINLTYFVFLGTIIPWEQYNNVAEGLSAWRLVVLAILVILFRRIPIMLALKTFIPDVKTWREALFAGHFGPIGVGAIFITILARAELEYEEAVPLSDTPPEGVEHYTLVALIWPIVTFLVISSIIVHGSSIAVFTLGKHINTLNLTLSYTTGPEEGPSWLNRLPRLSSQSKSQAPSMSETSQEDVRIPRFPPGTLPPVGARGQLLQRLEGSDAQRHGTRSLSSSGRRRRRSRSREFGEGGPVSQSAIAPISRTESDAADVDEKSPSHDGSSETMNDSHVDHNEPKAASEQSSPSEIPQELEVYDEGDNLVVENQDGEVLAIERSPSIRQEMVEAKDTIKQNAGPSTGFGPSWGSLKRVVGGAYSQEMQKRKTKDKDARKHEPARAYQFGNTIVIEDQEGEVIKQYELPSQKETKEGTDLLQQCQKYLGRSGAAEARALDEAPQGEASGQATKVPSRTGWFGGVSAAAARKKADSAMDDQQVRFTIDEQGKRMTKADFLQEVRKLDPKTRRETVERLSGLHSHTAVGKQASPPDDPAWHVQEAKSIQGVSQKKDEDGGELQAKRTDSETQRPAAGAPSNTTGLFDDETPAERRRREAALGVGATSGIDNVHADEDSDDEGTPRVPPSRRGIRFADDLRKTRQGK